MRKLQQQQLLQLLQTTKEAQAAGLYADCQECAITIGEFIESIEGEGTQTVTLLEDYCELLYRASNGEIGEKPLRKQIIKIENSIRSELKPNRIEMVFLSYKASMSDCLESIYTSAKDDPDCDAYWIPIPYYDLNPDGSFGTMHYEGADHYKENIKCTDWQDYDIEARCPDVIFTFAPYDALGHVTSVHTDYYCQRLRDLTSLLVYVPYYVTTDKIEEPYAKCPGVLYSHLVIVQSEKVRQEFIRNYKELEKIGYSREKYGAPEDKFVALGSPKIDAVVNVKPEDFTLPEAWRKLIENPDRTRKKAILFNTTVTPSLNNSEQYLKKLRFVIATFRNRDDVVLWWRPHPLIETAYSAINLDVAGEYRSIVEEYKRDGYGIYDDTPDLHRAIALSDAYYGDPSSVVTLYQMTGKPIMISDQKLLESTPPFVPLCIHVTKEKLWFSVRHVNALFSMDKKDWELEFVGSFPGECDYIEIYYSPLYFNPVEKNGKLYFPPCFAKEIAVLSLVEGTFKKIPFNENENITANDMSFNGAVAYGDYIYFTPCMASSIARLDTKTGDISYFSDWLEPLIKLTGTEQEHKRYFGGPITADDSIWLASPRGNIVVEFNMITCKSTLYEVGHKSFHYARICFDGENYWITPEYLTNSPVIKWNPQTGSVKEFHEIFTNSSSGFFHHLIFYCNYLWFLPLNDYEAIKIDTLSDVVTPADEIKSCPSDATQAKIVNRYSCVQVHGDSIFTFNQQNRMLIEYNCVTKVRREKEIRYSPVTAGLIEKLYNTKSHKLDATETKPFHNYYYLEGSTAWLNGFITDIVEGYSKADTDLWNSRAETARLLISNPNGTAGQIIFEEAKRKINS